MCVFDALDRRPSSASTPSAGTTCQAGDDHIDDSDDAVDDGMKDGTDGVDDAHETGADGVEDALDLVFG